jgi:carbamoyltransferase
MANDPDQETKHRSGRLKIIADYLKISKDKVIAIDHHKAHAYYSYYTSNMIGKDVLAFSVDGMGDNMNATISTFDKDGKWKRHYATKECGIARIYRYMTLLLGMKPNEHEFKVMGLAPYGKEKYAIDAYKVFEQTLQVKDTEFVWNIKPEDSYYWFKERLEGMRFDSIAWGLQHWVEKLLLEWTSNTIKKFKINDIIYSGGVAMNIKAMGKLTELDCVNNLFVGGSASDESLAIGSGICLQEDLTLKNNESWSSNNFSRIETLYLGPKSSSQEEDKIIKNLDEGKYFIDKDISAKNIGNLLSQGKIIGRCVDRMEFGQRALGNRSIIADPSNILIKEKINSAIKNRDFWMPFAPIVLDIYAEQYLVNPKKITSPHMTIGFQTTDLGYKKMIAACHPADKSVRPQILEKKHNPKLYEIIEEFSNIKNCGAILNTSFNLHGYPIVNSAKDAFYVFEHSELDVLQLNNFLIKKHE